MAARKLLRQAWPALCRSSIKRLCALDEVGRQRGPDALRGISRAALLPALTFVRVCPRTVSRAGQTLALSRNTFSRLQQRQWPAGELEAAPPQPRLATTPLSVLSAAELRPRHIRPRRARSAGRGYAAPRLQQSHLHAATPPRRPRQAALDRQSGRRANTQRQSTQRTPCVCLLPAHQRGQLRQRPDSLRGSERGRGPRMNPCSQQNQQAPRHDVMRGTLSQHIGRSGHTPGASSHAPLCEPPRLIPPAQAHAAHQPRMCNILRSARSHHKSPTARNFSLRREI